MFDWKSETAEVFVRYKFWPNWSSTDKSRLVHRHSVFGSLKESLSNYQKLWNDSHLCSERQSTMSFLMMSRIEFTKKQEKLYLPFNCGSAIDVLLRSSVRSKQLIVSYLSSIAFQQSSDCRQEYFNWSIVVRFIKPSCRSKKCEVLYIVAAVRLWKLLSLNKIVDKINKWFHKHYLKHRKMFLTNILNRLFWKNHFKGHF